MLKEIKIRSLNAFKENRRTCVIVSLISAFLVSGFFSVQATIGLCTHAVETFNHEFHLTNAQYALNYFNINLHKLSEDLSIGKYSDIGLISKVYWNVRIGGSLFFSFLNSLMQAIQKGSFTAFLIAVFVLGLTLVFYSFIQGVLSIGVKKFYMMNLEASQKNQIHADLVIFGFRRRKTLHLASCIIYKILALIPWAFTIVMFPVKLYAYRFYEYILAINPSLDPKDALCISEKMMHGRKWQGFCLDFSYLGWYVLGVFSFGLLYYFYVNPCRYSAWAAFFMQAKEQTSVTIPVDSIHDKTLRKLIDWRRDYSTLNLVLIFFIFSIVGWAWELIICFAQGQGFINRGTLYGPWLPIYGVGGVGTLIFFKRFRERPGEVFILSMLACGILEYATASALWAIKGLKYWDYTGFFFNIQGRTCLEGLLSFGAGCCVGIYAVAPTLDHKLNQFSLRYRKLAVYFFIAFFIVDFVCSIFYPRSGAGITSP
jgi:uncharacterized membrane protein